MMGSPATWLPDPSHYPEQMTPLSATTWFEAVGTGLHEAMREMRGPFGGFEARSELGWAYEGELEPEWETEEGPIEAAARALGEEWQARLRPRVRAITEQLNALRPELPPPAKAAALFDRMWLLVLEQWKLHFLVVVPAQIAIELFTAEYIRSFPDAEPLAPYRLLDAIPDESVEADLDLWRLAQRARALGVDDILREFPEDTVLDRLAQFSRGRAFRTDLDAYLARFGGRSRWHEVSLPREVERPAMTLESLRLFLDAPEPPSLARREESERLELETLASAPSLEASLTAAKVGYGLKESHVYHIDYPGLLALRELLLAFGGRLLADGRLDDPDDVWMLQRAELRSAIGNELDGGEIRQIIERRRGELARGRQEGVRPYLGEPPKAAERHAALEKFYGSSGRVSEGDILRGTGAAAGIAEGRVRIVSGARDFQSVQRHDVMVATTTTPAWTPLFPSLAALVTETGGILSHAAIVAREYGIPTVVGVDRATTLLQDGLRVRVDGERGEVRILSS